MLGTQRNKAPAVRQVLLSFRGRIGALGRRALRDRLPTDRIANAPSRVRRAIAYARWRPAQDDTVDERYGAAEALAPLSF